MQPAPEPGASAGPNGCCFNLNIPVSAWACSLLPVCAQAGDAATFDRIKCWLDRHYLREAGNEDDGSKMAWLGESVEWMVGNTAQYLLGLALQTHPDLYRRMVQQPLSRNYFQGPLLEAANWKKGRRASVFRCFVMQGKDSSISELHVGTFLPPKLVPSDALTLQLQISNVKKVGNVICNGHVTKFEIEAHTGQMAISIPLAARDNGRVEIRVDCMPAS